MPTVTQSKRINHPVRSVYDQWTRFESFPSFMEGVDSVDRTDERHLHWVASFGGEQHEWDAEIVEQTPDQRIAWRSTDGKTNAGTVSFAADGTTATEVTVEMQWEPEGLKERVGGALGFDDRQVKGDLDRFEAFLDERS